jgi:hypothetical protein
MGGVVYADRMHAEAVKRANGGKFGPYDFSGARPRLGQQEGAGRTARGPEQRAGQEF